MKANNLGAILRKDYLTEFFLRFLHTYGLCVFRKKGDAKKALTEGETIFALVQPTEFAFMLLQLLNNYDLWHERFLNGAYPTHACHSQKGGKYTSKTAGGGGVREPFKCGWDKEGVDLHDELLTFFGGITGHTMYKGLEDKGRKWWNENGKKTRASRSRSAGKKKTAAKFAGLGANMMGV